MVFGLFFRRRRESERSEKPRIIRIVGPLSSTYREAPSTVKETPPKEKKEKRKEKDRPKDKDKEKDRRHPANVVQKPRPMSIGPGIGPGIASTFVPPSPALSSQPSLASIPTSHPVPVYAGSVAHPGYAPPPSPASSPPLRPASRQVQRPLSERRPPGPPRPQSMPPGAFPANFRVDAGGASPERRRFFSNVPHDARLAAWDARNAERNRSKLPPRRDSIPVTTAATSASSVAPPTPPFPTSPPSPLIAPTPRLADGTPPLRLRTPFTDVHPVASTFSEGPGQGLAPYPSSSETQGQVQPPSQRCHPSQPHQPSTHPLLGMFEAPRPAPAPPLPPGAQPAKPPLAGSAAKSRRASEATAMALERGPSLSRRKPRPVSHYQLSSDAREASIVDSAPSIRPPSICRADDLAQARLTLSPRLSLASTPELDPPLSMPGGLVSSHSGGSSLYSPSPPSTPRGDASSGAPNGRAYAVASPHLNASPLPPSTLSLPITSPKVVTAFLPPGAHPSAMSPRMDVPPMPTSLRHAHDTPWAQLRDRNLDALPRRNSYKVVATPPSHVRQPSWVA